MATLDSRTVGLTTVLVGSIVSLRALFAYLEKPCPKELGVKTPGEHAGLPGVIVRDHLSSRTVLLNKFYFLSLLLSLTYLA